MIPTNSGTQFPTHKRKANERKRLKLRAARLRKRQKATHRHN